MPEKVNIFNLQEENDKRQKLQLGHMQKWQISGRNNETDHEVIAFKKRKLLIFMTAVFICTKKYIRDDVDSEDSCDQCFTESHISQNIFI